MKNTTKNNKFKKFIFKGSVIIVIGLVVTFSGINIWIKTDANSIAEEATEVFQKDKIESLLAKLDSDDYSLKEKNYATWALGVLKDERALPKLESLATGQECNHEKELCQREIEKAILKSKGEFRGSWQASN